MPIVTRWACNECRAQYDNENEARACENRPLQPPIVAAGDIVTVKAGFGWFDGDRSWVLNADAVDPKKIGGETPLRLLYPKRKCPNGDGNCFGDCCTFVFLYVVTHISLDPGTHRVRYHLVTPAMSGRQGYRVGWTCYPGHHLPVRANVPAAIVREGAALIGTVAEHLL